MALLILMRHGQSEWNRKNLFTGWVDVPLSAKGVEEAIEGGKQIADIPIDVIYTSTLIRAQMTATLAMIGHHSGKVPVIQHTSQGRLGDWATVYGEDAQIIPVHEAWELNERYYGELQGRNKDECRAKWGAEQVHIWRRSYDIPPPNGESLKLTAARAIPYYTREVVPHLDEGRNVFIAAHGNSLRSIVMDLDGLSETEVVKLEIPTGQPIIYSYDEGSYTKK